MPKIPCCCSSGPPKIPETNESDGFGPGESASNKGPRSDGLGPISSNINTVNHESDVTSILNDRTLTNNNSEKGVNEEDVTLVMGPGPTKTVSKGSGYSSCPDSKDEEFSDALSNMDSKNTITESKGKNSKTSKQNQNNGPSYYQFKQSQAGAAGGSDDQNVKSKTLKSQCIDDVYQKDYSVTLRSPGSRQSSKQNDMDPDAVEQTVEPSQAQAAPAPASAPKQEAQTSILPLTPHPPIILHPFSDTIYDIFLNHLRTKEHLLAMFRAHPHIQEKEPTPGFTNEQTILFHENVETTPLCFLITRNKNDNAIAFRIRSCTLREVHKIYSMVNQQQSQNWTDCLTISDPMEVHWMDFAWNKEGRKAIPRPPEFFEEVPCEYVHERKKVEDGMWNFNLNSANQDSSDQQYAISYQQNNLPKDRQGPPIIHFPLLMSKGTLQANGNIGHGTAVKLIIHEGQILGQNLGNLNKAYERMNQGQNAGTGSKGQQKKNASGGSGSGSRIGSTGSSGTTGLSENFSPGNNHVLINKRTKTFILERLGTCDDQTIVEHTLNQNQQTLINPKQLRISNHVTESLHEHGIKQTIPNLVVAPSPRQSCIHAVNHNQNQDQNNLNTQQTVRRSTQWSEQPNNKLKGYESPYRSELLWVEKKMAYGVKSQKLLKSEFQKNSKNPKVLQELIAKNQKAIDTFLKSCERVHETLNSSNLIDKSSNAGNSTGIRYSSAIPNHPSLAKLYKDLIPIAIYEIRLVAMPSKTFMLEFFPQIPVTMGTCGSDSKNQNLYQNLRPILTCPIAGKQRCILFHIYCHADETKVVPKVQYINMHGYDLDGECEVIETHHP